MSMDVNGDGGSDLVFGSSLAYVDPSLGHSGAPGSDWSNVPGWSDQAVQRGAVTVILGDVPQRGFKLSTVRTTPSFWRDSAKRSSQMSPIYLDLKSALASGQIGQLLPDSPSSVTLVGGGIKTT